MKKKAKKASAAAPAGPKLGRKKVMMVPFGAATFVLSVSIVTVYVVLSNGAAYPSISAIMAGALGVSSLPFGVITYLFIHAGIGHLLENLIALAAFCLVVEAALSYWDAIAIFFISGIAGGLAFIAVSPELKIIGASAGIVGLAVAGILADPKRGLLVLVFVALAVNYVAPPAADWIASESNKLLQQQKQLAQQQAQTLAEQQKPAEAQKQLEIAQEKQTQIDAQAEAKKREEEAKAGDAAHVVGAAVGALYVLAFRREAVYSWMRKADYFFSKRGRVG